LQRLDLGRNLPTRLNGRALAGCPLLQSLVLCGNKLAAAPTGLTYPLLRRLWLNGNELTRVWAAPPTAEEEGGAGAEKGAGGAAPGGERCWLPSLDTLNLHDNQIGGGGGGDGGGSLAASISLAHCASLTSLDLSFNNLCAVRELAPLGACAALRTLSLNDNPVCLQPRYRRSVIALLPRLLRELDGVAVAPTQRAAVHARSTASRAHLTMPFLRSRARANAFVHCPQGPAAAAAAAASVRGAGAGGCGRRLDLFGEGLESLATDVQRADAELASMEPATFGEGRHVTTGAGGGGGGVVGGVAAGVPWSDMCRLESALQEQEEREARAAGGGEINFVVNSTCWRTNPEERQQAAFSPSSPIELPSAAAMESARFPDAWRGVQPDVLLQSIPIFVLLVADSTAVPAVLATVVALFAAIYNCLPRRRVCNHFKTRCGHLAFHCAAMVTALGAVQASAGSQSAAQQQPLGAKASLLNVSPVGYFCCGWARQKIAICSVCP
jgi:hypothetical protein